MFVSKPICWTVLLLVLMFSLPFSAMAQDEKEEAAKEAAMAWVALIDNADYVSSWEQAGTLLQDALTKEAWASAAQGARDQIAGIAPDIDYATRGLVSAQYAKDPPNAPPGEYVIAQYAITANDQRIIETISVTLQDEAWKVVGYFIQPEQ